jgi:phosphoglucosamine mutase
VSERIFGTDGIRGKAGEGWLSPESTAQVALAVARTVLAKRASAAEPPRALLGHDGRLSGPPLLAAFARGLGSEGFVLENAGLISTPGLALLTRERRADLGVMISASHNPAEDNGIKVFGGGGEKLSDADERLIERALLAGTGAVPQSPAPPVREELAEQYRAALLNGPGRRLDLTRLRLVVDCANGGASQVAPQVLQRLGAEVHAIHARPDGLNINLKCGSTHPASLQAEVRARGADLGCALDGDGDRCLLVDERGELVDGDAMLALLARHAVQRDAWRDRRLVTTVMSNKGLARAVRDVGVSLVLVDVGDRNVVEALRRESLSLGGEQSGHIVFGAENHYIGDGVYTALRVLRVLRESGKRLSELAACFQAFPQVLINVPVARKPALSTLPGVIALQGRIEQELGEDGRVLLRYSGTEALARVMIEGPDLERITSRAQELAGRIAAEIGR